MSSSPVPLLDLNQDINTLAGIFRHACKEHGFVLLTNHGISPDIIAAHADAQRRFFTLPDHLKRTIIADHNNRGYTPLGDETLDPANSKQGDNKEGLYFGREVDDEEAEKPLHGPNQWPDEVYFIIYNVLNRFCHHLLSNKY